MTDLERLPDDRDRNEDWRMAGRLAGSLQSIAVRQLKLFRTYFSQPVLLGIDFCYARLLAATAKRDYLS
jgi:hypothetical protein